MRFCFRDGTAFGNGRAAVGVLFPLHDERCGIDMFAVHSASFMVKASTSRHLDVDLILVIARLRWDEPNALLSLNDSRCCQFHSALFSQVHNHLLYLRNILLSRCISVKGYFENSSLDNISLSSIIPVWDWSRSSKKATNAAVANTNGFRDTAPLVNQGFVLNANPRIGINLGNTSEKHYNLVLIPTDGWCGNRTRKCLSDTMVFKTTPLPIRDNHLSVVLEKVWRRKWDSNPRRLWSRPSQASDPGVLVLQTSGLNRSPIPPLNGSSEGGASQTFAPHLSFKNHSSLSENVSGQFQQRFFYNFFCFRIARIRQPITLPAMCSCDNDRAFAGKSLQGFCQCVSCDSQTQPSHPLFRYLSGYHSSADISAQTE